MNKTDEILERLRTAQQPVIDDPDMLLERIMGSLDAQDSQATTFSLKGRQWDGSLVIIRTVLSIAALWLIGLFIYTTSDTPAHQLHEQQGLPYYTYSVSSGSTLKDVYTSRQRKEKTTVSYTQLRSKLYENK